MAGLGPLSGLRLQVMEDALVRVIQASLRQPVDSVALGGQPLAPGLKFATTTSYQAVAPVNRTVTVTGSAIVPPWAPTWPRTTRPAAG